MEQNNKKKTLILSILGVLLLIGSVIGITYSFFNYTRTGTENTIKTGNISFNSTQDNTISLTNVFPISSNSLNSTNSDTVTINITGDTTYSEGIEYKVTLESVNNTINGKEVPISIKATATNLGTEDSSYYTNRENKTKIYLLNEEGEAYNGKYIAVGYIPAGSTGVNGSIDITAFIDTNKVAISDTYDGTESDLMGTTNDWVMGREVFTTTEWNSFDSGNTLSFKVKVEANEGIWVEPERFLTIKSLSSDSNWRAIRANITSIEFHKDGVVPENFVTSFDVTDVTSAGPVTLYTVDDGLGNNTYKAIVVADDTIYAPASSVGLFSSMSNLITFNFRNFRLDNVTNMAAFFSNDSHLSNVSSLSYSNTSNIENVGAVFQNCTDLTNISFLKNLNVSNVTNMNGMFRNCAGLTDITSLSNWNVSNVTAMAQMFDGCTSLEYVSGINDWDITSVTDFGNMFRNTINHPEFTKVTGTWNTAGTFTPNA